MARLTTQPILLIGAGHMGGALLRGWMKQKLTPIIVVEPNPSPELKRAVSKSRVVIVPDIESARVKKIRAGVVALKPQILKTEAARFRGIANLGAPMISIAAGTMIGSLQKAWGPKARIVRAMPNVPGAIGHGISGLYAPKNATAADRKLTEELLCALGPTVWLKNESLIDTVTALSGSGPAYIFLMVEALAEAGEREGLPRVTAKKLARAMVAGAGALLDYDPRAPEDLRRSVTSPHGTTEAALNVLMAKDGLKPLIQRAVTAARKRGAELGKLS
jgi:pyrroline-5-carboxylate reductase